MSSDYGQLLISARNRVHVLGYACVQVPFQCDSGQLDYQVHYRLNVIMLWV